jgi:hypothetical protein
LRICILLALDALHCVGLDILGLCSYLFDVFLGLTPEHLATLGMFCNLLSDDWKLSSHLSMCSGYSRAHGAYPLLMGQNTLAFLFPNCYFLSTLYFCFLPRSSFCILLLLGCILCDYPRCETCAFACFLCRLPVNVSLIARMMAPEKSWCLVECPARWEPQEEGVMSTAARFSLS